MKKLQLNPLKILTSVRNIIRKFWEFLTRSSYIEPYKINYGLLELKKSYRAFVVYGLSLSVLLHILILVAFFISAMVKQKDENSSKKNKRIINVKLIDLPPPPSSLEEEVFIPPPPSKEEPPPVPKKDMKALQPEPVKKEKSEEHTIKTQKELEEIKSPVSETGDTAIYYYGEEHIVEDKKIEEKIIKKEKREKVKEKKEKTIFQSFEVEKAPEAVNLAQVKASIVYPSFAIEAGIEGRVTVKVLVGKYGEVTKVGKITGPEVFHDEVKDKVKDLTFTPGLQNGKAVKVWVTVPFVFKLK